MDCGGGVGVIVVVVVGVIGLYVRVLFSVIASFSTASASSISCSPLTCLNDSR